MPELVVLVRTQAQLDAVLSSGASTVYLDFEDPKRYREAVAAVAPPPFPGRSPEVWVAPRGS